MNELNNLIYGKSYLNEHRNMLKIAKCAKISAVSAEIIGIKDCFKYSFYRNYWN